MKVRSLALSVLSASVLLSAHAQPPASRPGSAESSSMAERAAADAASDLLALRRLNRLQLSPGQIRDLLQWLDPLEKAEQQYQEKASAASAPAAGALDRVRTALVAGRTANPDDQASASAALAPLQPVLDALVEQRAEAARKISAALEPKQLALLGGSRPMEPVGGVPAGGEPAGDIQPLIQAHQQQLEVIEQQRQALQQQVEQEIATLQRQLQTIQVQLQQLETEAAHPPGGADPNAVVNQAVDQPVDPQQALQQQVRESQRQAELAARRADLVARASELQVQIARRQAAFMARQADFILQMTRVQTAMMQLAARAPGPPGFQRANRLSSNDILVESLFFRPTVLRYLRALAAR